MGRGGGAQQSYLILTAVSYLEYEQIPELIQTLGIIRNNTPESRIYINYNLSLKCVSQR